MCHMKFFRFGCWLAIVVAIAAYLVLISTDPLGAF